MNTAELMKPVKLVVEKLSKSENLKAYCIEKYKKEPLFLIGMDANDLPKAEDCPYIVILPNEKSEGLKPELHYMFNVMWCICNENTARENNIIKFTGIYEADELGQIILKEVTETFKNAEIGLIDYTIDPITNFPQVPGEMQITLTVPYVIGQRIIEF